MSGGRTVWWAKDAAWWRREWIVELGEEFGSAGPAVIDWLSSEAKSQHDAGFVKTGRKSVSRGCFVDSVTVGHVLSRSVTLGLLEDFDEREGRFTCRISGWQADQDRAQAAGRKAKQRALASVVTVSHGESRSVTQSHVNRTVDIEEAKASSSPDRSAAGRLKKEREKASDDDQRLCRLLAELILEHNPKAKVKSEFAWLNEMRLLRERDGNAPDETERLIRWIFTDKGRDARFWADVIRSPGNLREHFAAIWGKMIATPLHSVSTVEDSAAYLARRGAE